MRASTVVTAVVFAAVGVGAGLLLQGARGGGGASFKDVALVVDDPGSGCRASFVDKSQKKEVTVDKDTDGVAWQITNKSANCMGRALHIRAKVPGPGRKALPGACRKTVDFPGDVAPGDTLDPALVCHFPRQLKYEAHYVYEVALCDANGGGCQEADPEIDVKRH